MRNNVNERYLTLGGPIIIPVQCVRVMSSSFSRPQLIVPSPTPFWPCSNSSKRRKFRGTTVNESHFSQLQSYIKRKRGRAMFFFFKCPQPVPLHGLFGTSQTAAPYKYRLWAFADTRAWLTFSIIVVFSNLSRAIIRVPRDLVKGIAIT